MHHRPDHDARRQTRRGALALISAVAAVTTAVIGMAGNVHAQGAATATGGTAAWPTRPIRLVVGFPGGSTPDMAARALSEGLAKALGQPVVVDNKPGASGNLAADAVAKANDDHTLGIVINGNLTSAKQLNPRLPYDPARDFSLLSLVGTAPLVLVSPADLPAGADYLKAARAAAGTWSYGSVGIGSVGHLGMEVVKAAIGYSGNSAAQQPVHVPYNGNPAVVTALIGGQIQMALVPPGIALPQVKGGKLHAIGLTGPRSALAPDIAPLSDLGLRMAPLEVWVALVGPANLSKAAHDRLAREVPVLVREPETRQRLLAAGWEPQGGTPEAFKARVAEESRILGDIITSRGIKLE